LAEFVLQKPPVRNVVLVGAAVVAVFFGIFGVWASVAPLSTAAIAPGEVTVESKRKTVQHFEGGIVGEILVRDGTEVKAGQVLVRLERTQAQAMLSLVDGRLLSAQSLAARLRAERDGADDLIFPAHMQARAGDPDYRTVMDGQRRIFKARRNALKSKIALLRKRDAQVRIEIGGLRAQLKADDRQLALIEEELSGIRSLVARGLVAKPRLLALERRAAEISGGRGRNIAAISRAQQSMGETRLKIEELRAERTNEVVRELREVESELHDLTERRSASGDVLTRTEIRAPIAGTVVGLKIATTGGVIAAGEAIMDIVPADDRLIVEAKVSPQDIDIVRAGLSAQVRFTALSQRNSVPVEGDVISVSADRLADQFTPEGYYLARVALAPDILKALGGVKLQPGMQAEVMIVTGANTALGYFMKPVANSFNRAFREE
jgi:HlyD family type I secretion membrane fusion protein